jgi:glycine cleavage system regulatory protein
MTASLVVTTIGPDRPGLVNLLSNAAQAVGANWTASRMAHLSGQFAGIVEFEVDDARADALEAALRNLASSGLHVVIARTRTEPQRNPRQQARLELVGHDRPGIVRELSGALTALGVNIEELETHVTSAAMAGGNLFKMRALLAVPDGVTTHALRASLEALANEMMIDLELGNAMRD